MCIAKVQDSKKEVHSSIIILREQFEKLNDKCTHLNGFIKQTNPYYCNKHVNLISIYHIKLLRL